MLDQGKVTCDLVSVIGCGLQVFIVVTRAVVARW